MIILISPAKSLDFESPAPTDEASLPVFLGDETAQLADILKGKSASDLGRLMSLSEKLTELNYQRYQHYQTPLDPAASKQAVFSFTGDVYQGLDAGSLKESEILALQKKLRILSGFYGLLKPLDRILPYRLEMGTKLGNERGSNLYQFWGSRITLQLQGESPNWILNLASNEYFKAVKLKELQAPVITPIFKDEKKGQYKVISFLAKRARGLMTRWVIQEGIEEVEQLSRFSLEGYQYSPQDSTIVAPLFIRSESARSLKG